MIAAVIALAACLGIALIVAATVATASSSLCVPESDGEAGDDGDDGGDRDYHGAFFKYA